jgi:hypothetical protein
VVLDGIDHWIPEHAPEAVNRFLLAHLGANPIVEGDALAGNE